MARKRTGASNDAPVFFTPERNRWGLCCQFLDSPIKFRQATHRYVATLDSATGLRYLSDIVRSNADALIAAITECSVLGIGAFRISSGIMPLATHPTSGYTLATLEDADMIVERYQAAGALARTLGIRLSFHPDQFVVLNSATDKVVESSVREMNHQATVAELVGAEALTLHVGGKTGGVEPALERLQSGVEKLSASARERLALENDDRLFSPADILPFCERNGIPFIYDVHHHRCNPDGRTVTETTERAIATWKDREPWMHLSSPREGWSANDTRPHADFVDPADFPEEWRGVRMTIDVEAKQKERAVIAIRDAVAARAE